jgi:hypothetical protein
MAREYVISSDNVTLASATSPIIVFINPVAAGATGSGIEIVRCWASQRAGATSAQTGVALGTKISVFPTLTSATPAKTKLSDPTSGIVGGTAGAAGTCGVNASANGAGTEIAVVNDNFNNLTGWVWYPSPSETFVLMPGGTSGFFMKLLGSNGTTTVSPAASWSWGVAFKEIG